MNKVSTPTMLASLGVAAGALAATSAEATVVTHAVNQSGGQIGGGPVGLLVPITGTGVSLSFAPKFSFINGGAFTTSVSGVGANFLFEVEHSASSRNFALPVAKGTKFDAGASGYKSAMMDIRSSGGSTIGPEPSGLQYFNFLFSTAGKDYTGWFSGSYQNTSFSNVYFTVKSVAYDTTASLLLGAGATSDTTSPPPAIPEPSSVALLALGAMVTGAAATRRYKRARRIA